MSDSTTSNLWNEDWIKAQRQYWEAWAALANQSATQADAAAPTGNPWGQALDNWWQAVSKAVPAENRNLYSHVVEQGKAFMQMSQAFTGVFNKVGEAAKSGQDWQEALKACFDEMKAGFAQSSAMSMPEVMNGFKAFAEMPMDTLRRTFVGFSAMPGDCFQNLRSDIWEKIGSQVHTDMEKFLSVPGVGYTREGQEEVQRLSRLLLVYQRAMQDYLTAHGKLYSDALDRLYDKLIELGKKGESIKSVRILYDIWVDCNEEAYADFVMSPEFQDVYAKMVNAVMAVKHQTRLLLDENLGALNMPTRGEINGLIKRHHDLQRTVKSLLRERAAAGKPAVKQETKKESPAEVNVLRREVEQLKTQLAAAKSPTPVAEVKRAVPAPVKRAVPTVVAKKPVKAVTKPAKRKVPSWDISSIAKADEKPAQGRRRAGKR